jgi:folate-binding Fe-S cluster repair protein YgfZ
MANFELIGGVSSTGCHAGQEVVARTQHLGRVKRRMFSPDVAAAAAAGDDLYSEDLGDQAGGMVVNAEPARRRLRHARWCKARSRDGSPVHLKSLDGPALRFLLPYTVA